MRNQRMDLFQCAAIYSVVPLHIKTGLLDGQTVALPRFATAGRLGAFWRGAPYLPVGRGAERRLAAVPVIAVPSTGIAVLIRTGQERLREHH